MRMFSLTLCAIAVLIGLGALALWRLADHDLSARSSDPFAFTNGRNRLSGTLWWPKAAPRAALVLIHGDGPQDRVSGGGYVPNINTLLDAGFAVAAWDKPGIGASSGDWLAQSMADRTAETRSALATLRDQVGDIPVGALGFSQAGWVLPNLRAPEADFLILIGAAVSWQAQSDYFTTQRLTLLGVAPAEIQAQIAKDRADDDLLFSHDMRAEDLPDTLSPERWRFIRTNRDADASAALAGLDIPTLAIWGAQDLNVDPDSNAQAYRELLPATGQEHTVKIWPDATHGLLKAAPYNWQQPEQWSLWAKLRFLIEGRHAFAPGAWDDITAWIGEQNP